MKASVIIPTCQRPISASQTLSSVIRQSFSQDEYEILVVDNAQQPIGALASACDSSSSPSIRYVHEPDNGLHHARHTGARAAKGEILVYVDDDVLCPRGWLAAMIEPFQNPRIAMVGGKVVLHYDVSPPEWLPHFSDLLSAFDRGDSPHAMAPYDSPVGCNMSVRGSVLFAVGGFNPDGFGDRRLIHLRGDGECGLARKVHDAGFIVWYAPGAWLEHRVPAHRMTREYIEWRSAIGGVEAAYSDLRYGRLTARVLLTRSVRSILALAYHRARAFLSRNHEGRHIHHRAAASYHRGQARQRVKQALSKDLRQHTVRWSYAR